MERNKNGTFNPFLKKMDQDMSVMNPENSKTEVVQNNVQALALPIGAIFAFLGIVKTIGAWGSKGYSIVNTLKAILWPVDAAQQQWQKFIEFAEELIAEKLSTYARETSIKRLEGLQNHLALYTDALEDWEANPTDSNLMERVRDEFRNVHGEFESSMPLFQLGGYEIALLPVFAQAANLHLLLLRDADVYGKRWGMHDSEIEDHYNKQKFRIERYTDYCSEMYKIGLSRMIKFPNLSDYKKYPWLQYVGFLTPPRNSWLFQEMWNSYNAYRRSYTIAVLDIVALWPTYDFRRYSRSTKVLLTRWISSSLYGLYNGSFDTIENKFASSSKSLNKRLVQQNFWINENTDSNGSQIIVGDSRLVSKFGGHHPEQSFEGPFGSISNTNKQVSWNYDPRDPQATDPDTTNLRISHFIEPHVIRPSGRPPQSTVGNLSTYFHQDFNLPDHRLVYVQTNYEGVKFDTKDKNAIRAVTFILQHQDQNYQNIIGDSSRIYQIPAVNAYFKTADTSIVPGPSFTGGNLVKLRDAGNDLTTQLRIKVENTHPSPNSTGTGFTIRVRYACIEDAELFVGKYVDIDGQSYVYETGVYPVTRTFSGSDDPANMKYNSFKYVDTIFMLANELEFKIELRCDKGSIYIDRIEFVPE